MAYFTQLLTTKITEIQWIKFIKKFVKTSHVFLEIAQDVILKLNIDVGRQPTRLPPSRRSLASPLTAATKNYAATTKRYVNSIIFLGGEA